MSNERALALPDQISKIEHAIEAYQRAGMPGPWPGCYVFRNADGVAYVGESKNVRKRIASHERKYLQQQGAEVVAFPCGNRKEVERWLIGVLKPSLNGVSHEQWVAARRRKEAGFTEADAWQHVNDALFGPDGLFGDLFNDAVKP